MLLSLAEHKRVAGFAMIRSDGNRVRLFVPIATDLKFNGFSEVDNSSAMGTITSRYGGYVGKSFVH